MREIAYRHLNDLLAGLPADRPAFAAGDFNTTSTEDARDSMLERHVRPHWQVAHDHCAGCPGTQYYAPNDSWSFLDMILFSPGRGGETTWQMRANSVAIANNNPAQITENGTPQRYVSATRTGVSDHWPIIVTIEYTEIQ